MKHSYLKFKMWNPTTKQKKLYINRKNFVSKMNEKWRRKTFRNICKIESISPASSRKSTRKECERKTKNVILNIFQIRRSENLTFLLASLAPLPRLYVFKYGQMSRIVKGYRWAKAKREKPRLTFTTR